MKLALLIFVCIFSTPIWGAGQITEILGPREVTADIFDDTKFQTEKIVIIVSRKLNQAVAFGRIKKINNQTQPHSALIEIIELIDNNLLMIRDIVYAHEAEILREKKVPGFTSLTLHGDSRIPSRYKELANFGVFTSEGHTLDHQELLISPFQLQYGVTDDFGIRMVNALWLDGYANLGFKYRASRSKYARISLNTLGAYKIQSQDYIWQAGGIVTLPSNAKFMNHFMLNITFDPQFSEAHATKGLGLFQDTDIRNITEYITDSWNRILYGPTYNVELQTFGGTVSYMWIWDNFHTSLGLATRDLSELSFGKKGYYYVYDLFWRF